MKCKCLVLTVVAMVGGLTAQAGDGGKTDKDKIQGDWELASITIDGKPFTDLPKKLVVTFKGDKVTSNDVKDKEDSFKLDEAKKPRQIDIQKDGKKQTERGIYELAGDTLKIAFSKEVEKRPESLTGGKDVAVLTFKRVTKK